MQPTQIYITKHRAEKENPKPLKDKKKSAFSYYLL